MAHLLASNPSPSHKLVCSNLGYGAGRGSRSGSYRVGRKRRGSGLVLQCSSSTSTSTISSQLPCVDQNVRLQIENGSSGKLKQQFEYLACEYGWRVRRLFENADEIRRASEVQAEAFHIPVSIFNDLFFQFFQVFFFSFQSDKSLHFFYQCLKRVNNSCFRFLKGHFLQTLILYLRSMK